MLKNKYYIYGNDLQVPAHLQYGKYLFQRIKAQDKNKLAIINGESGDTLTYGELTQQVVDIALSLTRIGVTKGDVVAICSEKNFNYIPTVLAIACAGAIICTVDVTSEGASILHRLKLAKPKLMFCSANTYNHRESFSTIPGLNLFIVYGDQPKKGAILFKDFLTEHANVEDFLPVPVEAEDTVIILFSTGTTGLPKGNPWTNRGFLTGVLASLESTFYKDKVVLNTREWYNSFGLIVTLSSIADGATVVYCPGNNTSVFLDAILAYKVQTVHLALTTLIEFIESSTTNPRDTKSLEIILIASTPCNAELIISAKSKFPSLHNVYQFYGMTDIGALATDQMLPKGIKYGSVGLICPGMEIKVVDVDTRVPLGPMQRGELCAKSVSYKPRYLGLDSDNLFDEEGFFKTGDIAYYDEDNYIYLVDRIKELIKFNSISVAPAELEAVLENHPAVREACVVGAPHKLYGEVPTAFVVMQPGATITADELTQYVDGQVFSNSRLAGGIRFLKHLPRFDDGKLNRKQLKLQLSE